MTAADFSLRYDHVYEPIARRFHQNLEGFADAFARAWFKLAHRDMGPRSCYLGPEIPEEELIRQNPVPAVDNKLIDAADIAELKARILASGLYVPELVSTSWASASTFRGFDKRGGANGVRIRLVPQRGWEANEPERLTKVLKILRGGSRRSSTPSSPAERVFPRRPHRPGRLRRRQAGCEERQPRGDRPFRAQAHGRVAGADRRGLVRRALAGRGRVPQLPEGQVCRQAGGAASGSRATLSRHGTR